jgi:hypothetical protein
MQKCGSEPNKKCRTIIQLFAELRLREKIKLRTHSGLCVSYDAL